MKMQRPLNNDRGPWRKGLLATFAVMLALPLTAQAQRDDVAVDQLDITQPPDRQMRLFPLGYAEANSLALTVDALLESDIEIQITVDPRTNAIIARGTRENLQRLQDIIAMLDTPGPKPVEDDFMVKVFALSDAEADNDLLNILLTVTDGMNVAVALDQDRNQIIARGEEADLEVLEALLLRLDQVAAEDRRDRSMRQNHQVRLAWLSTGSGDEGQELPDDLAPVAEELARVGIEAPRLVTQFLVNVSASGEFDLQGTSQFGGRWLVSVSGDVEGPVQEGELSEMTIEIELHQNLVVQGGGSGGGLGQGVAAASENCQVRTQIAAPVGHYVVLGASPVGDRQFIFVLQFVGQD